MQFDHLKRQEVGENLAAELHSSLGDTPWKKQMGRYIFLIKLNAVFFFLIIIANFAAL
jgi:hypothetical protein